MDNKKILILISLSIVILISSCILKQEPQAEESSLPQIQQTPPQKPLQQIQQNQMPGNPLIDHNTYLTFSSDGKNWKQGLLIRKSASVPDLVQFTREIGKFK